MVHQRNTQVTLNSLSLSPDQLSHTNTYHAFPDTPPYSGPPQEPRPWQVPDLSAPAGTRQRSSSPLWRWPERVWSWAAAPSSSCPPWSEQLPCCAWKSRRERSSQPHPLFWPSASWRPLVHITLYNWDCSYCWRRWICQWQETEGRESSVCVSMSAEVAMHL